MRHTRFSGFLVFMVLSILLAGNVHAHSALVSSTPAKDSVIPAPQQITLNFNADVRLLRVALAPADGQDIDIGFRPDTVAGKLFEVDLPPLEAGEYTVNWAIVGADGHTVGDKFSFTVDPNAEEPGEEDMHGPTLEINNHQDHASHAADPAHAPHQAAHAASAGQSAAGASGEHQH